MRNLFFLIAMFLAWGNASGQLSLTKIPSPDGGAIIKMKRAQNGLFVILTQGGSLYRSTTGESWSEITFHGQIQDFTIASNRIVVIASDKSEDGFKGSIYTSDNFGISFAKRNSPQEFVSGIESMPGNKVIMITGSSFELKKLYISGDLGDTWMLQNSDVYNGKDFDPWWSFGGSLEPLKILSDGTIFVLGTGGLYKSDDEGISFSLSANGSFQVEESTNAIYNDDNNEIEVSKNKGLTWQKISVPPVISGFARIAAIHDTLYFVRNDVGKIFSTVDDGQSWQSYASAGLPTAMLRNLYHFGNTLFALPSNEGLYVSKDFGRTWMSAHKGINANFYGGITVKNGKVFLNMAAGGYYKNLTSKNWTKMVKEFRGTDTWYINDGKILISTNLLKDTLLVSGGVEFRLSGGQGRDYKFASIGNTYYRSSLYSTELHKSEKTSLTWSVVQMDWKPSYEQISAFTPDGMGSMVLSTSYGKMTVFNPSSNANGGTLTGINNDVVDLEAFEGVLYALALEQPYKFSLYKSTNSGLNWVLELEGIPYWQSSFGTNKVWPSFFKSKNNLFVGGTGALYSKSKSEEKWEKTTLSDIPNHLVSAVHEDSLGNIYVTVDNQGIFKTGGAEPSGQDYRGYGITKWFDADNDSLLDIASDFNSNDSLQIANYQNKLSHEFVDRLRLKTNFTNSSIYSLTDFNHDNKIDIVISGTLLTGESSTQVYINKGNFKYEKLATPVSTKAFQTFLFADLNNDGVEELIGADTQKLNVLVNASGIFVPKADTSLSISSLQAFDFDGNGFKDIAFSGYNHDGEPITMIWLLEDNLSILKRLSIASVAGTLEAGDLNHDGFFDLVVSGKDLNGDLTTKLFENNKDEFVLSSSLIGLDSASIKIADFTSDGLADVALRGKDSSGNYINWIRTFSGDSISLPANVKSQDFGDYDRDGDLDWVQLTGDSLKIFTNNLGPENKGPGKPTNAIGLQVYDRMFFYWEKPVDDHTSVNSITYDLKIFNADTTIVAAEFDAINRNRLLVSHGNMGTTNFTLQKIQDNYNFEIQAIDNAFIPQVKSICSGVCSPCATLDQQNVLACGEAPTILTPPAPQAMWFSFKRGFLGIGDSFEFNESEPDTVFSFNPTVNASCASLRIFNIQTSQTDTIKITHTHRDCIGRNVTMEVSAGWENIVWNNNLNSTTFTGKSLVHNLAKDVIFVASGNNGAGCVLEEEFILKVSKPNLQVNGNQFQIISGNSVQLIASGGNLFEWNPPSSLSDHQIADPIAKPTQTIEYTVTAYDTLGCTSKAKILVEVFEEAFIPTLFTPNADGKNDNLRIYGLTQASDFHFAIYNREGSKLFETTSVVEATQNGWTGSVNGNHQPPGTYYWKVKGQLPNGELLLNGKKSGVILLVR